MDTVLGLDLGTQSLKAVFYDYEKQTVVAVVSAPLEVNRDSRGKAEQHAHWWLQALGKCLHSVDAGIRQSVRAIGVSGQQHGLVALDATSEVLTPVKLWCDTATQSEVEELTRRLGGRHQAIALTGNPVLAGYTSPKILWLKNQHPELYERMQHILLPHDYLNFVLTGNHAMEFGDASGTGLLDVRSREWSRDILHALDADRDLAACLPPLYEAQQMIGCVTDQAAAEYGLPAGTPVATGGGDNMMAAIGTGNVVPGELTISLGSSGTLYTYADSPVIDPGGHIAAFCSSSGGWLPLLCTMNCTMATEFMRGPLGVSLEEFDKLVAQAPAGSGGLTMLPFFSGERTPDLPRARATLYGLDAQNCSREHLMRATVEATTYSLRYGLDCLRRLGLEGREIVLTGGGSQSGVWRQVIADIFRLPVKVFRQNEGASFGAALQALWMLAKMEGENTNLAALCSQHLTQDLQRSCLPDPGTVGLYEEGYQDYTALLNHMTPLMEGRL